MTRSFVNSRRLEARHDIVGGELRKARLVGGKAKWVIATGQKAPTTQNLYYCQDPN